MANSPNLRWQWLFPLVIQNDTNPALMSMLNYFSINWMTPKVPSLNHTRLLHFDFDSPRKYEKTSPSSLLLQDTDANSPAARAFAEKNPSLSLFKALIVIYVHNSKFKTFGHAV